MRSTAALVSAIAMGAMVVVHPPGGAHGEEVRPRARDLGIAPGALAPGPLNAISDVEGVRVGHVSLVEGDAIRTGATAIVPHAGNLFHEKVPAAVVVGNGFGKLVGSTQVDELGELETPIMLTNTLNVWEAAAALVEYTLEAPGNEVVRSVNPLVGETNDGWLSDIRRRPLRAEHFRAALDRAAGGPVPEGAVGAGVGTMTFGFKGGIGTSSRRVADTSGGFVVGALVQTNFGGRLSIDGVPVWHELAPAADLRDRPRSAAQADASVGAVSAAEPVADASARSDDGDDPPSGDGSCVIVVATDAPLDARQLKRLARRALVGMARTGANFAHGSGDYVVAFSTNPAVRIVHEPGQTTRPVAVFEEAALTPLFEAVADATEEAIYNALLRATTTRGRNGHVGEAIPIGPLRQVLSKYGRGNAPPEGDRGE